MNTIIPNIEKLWNAVNVEMERMIRLSGGENGRDFTDPEQEAFIFLLDARKALAQIPACRTRDQPQ